MYGVQRNGEVFRMKYVERTKPAGESWVRPFLQKNSQKQKKMCYNRNIFFGTEDKSMEKSKVYFTDFRTRLGEGLPSKLKRLMKAAGIQDMDMDHKFVAIKMHFGELGNLGYLRPNYAKAVADVVKELGGIPFLTDCNTLYPGSRKNAIEHMYCAWENGFTPMTVGCPVIREQEILVGRKNAELLALHSQINPHFLFNVLESIRMHSILKKENETADMVSKLAVMQRQYVEWGNDSVSIFQEIEFVKAYLALQKYRFGERLNYDIEVDRECENFKIPKLTIVTFVENACVHGIESKSSPGWIFVRIGRQGEGLEIEIEDTGSGMAEAKLTELQNNMCNADIEMLKGGGRVGIINACVRLKMVTENRVEFRVEGEEGVGTTVTIRIPCLQEGKTDAESIAGR